MKLTYNNIQYFDREGRFVEIIDGSLYNHPAPGLRHQRVVLNLFRILDTYIREKKLGEIIIAPFDLIFSQLDVVQPDLIFISQGKIDKLTERGFEGIPDLLIEVISRFSEPHDRAKKKPLYAYYGVQHFWIVDPFEKKVEIYELGEVGYEFKGIYSKGQEFQHILFPDLKIQCANIFEGV